MSVREEVVQLCLRGGVRDASNLRSCSNVKIYLDNEYAVHSLSRCRTLLLFWRSVLYFDVVRVESGEFRFFRGCSECVL